jgi:hypothetical protein
MNKYFQCTKGNMPVLISVPHGGALVPDDIPNRDFGSYKKDRNTVLVSKSILRAFETKGLKPYVIVMELHRRRIDVNRGSKEGAQHPEMLAVYKSYHNTIKEWRREIQQKFGYCLLIDLHGQKAKRGFVELGYGLSKEHLSSLDSLDKEELKKYSSLRLLLSEAEKAHDVIIGDRSFGTILSQGGYEVFPSLDCQHLEEIHFNGVYTLHRHVVNRRKEKMFGLNLELSFEGIRDTEVNREKFAASLAIAIEKYLSINFGKDQRWKREPKRK